MAVPEQTPYKEYTANGNTTSFALGFICESKNDLIVLVDNVAPPIATWSLVGGNAVFTTAPASGKKIVLQRNTAMSRTTNYQGNNNSFRPETINKDIDRVWLKLQELGVADMLLEIYVDRLHGEQKDYIDNKDQLVRNIITDLLNYVNQQDGSLSSDINNLRTHVNQQDNNRNSYFENLISRQGVSLQQLDSYYNYLMQRLAQIAVDKGWDASFVVDGDKTQKQINDDQLRKNSLTIDILEFIPQSEWAAIFSKTSNYDCGPALSQAIETAKQVVINSRGLYKIKTSYNGTTDFDLKMTDGVVLDLSECLGSYAITNSGSVTKLTKTWGALTAGFHKVTFNDVSGLEVGDWLCFYDPAEFSYSAWRANYNDGEWKQIKRIVGNTVSFGEPFLKTYIASLDLYKLNSVVCKLEGGEIINNSATLAGSIRFALSSNTQVHNISANAKQNSVILFDKCVEPKSSNINGTNEGAGTDDYFIVHSNCWNGYHRGGKIYSRRHAFAMGSGGGLCNVPNTRSIVEHAILECDEDARIGSADMHGNVRLSEYRKCTIFGGCNIGGGEENYYRGCKITSSSGGQVGFIREMIGGKYGWIDCDFTFTADPQIENSSSGVLDLGSNLAYITEKTTKDSTIVLKNIRVNDTGVLLDATTSFVKLANRGTTKKINIDFNDITFNTTSKFNFGLSMTMVTGDAASDYIIFDNVKGNTPSNRLVSTPRNTEGKSYMDSPWRLPISTGKVQITTSAAQVNTSAVVTLPFTYHKMPLALGLVARGVDGAAKDTYGGQRNPMLSVSSQTGSTFRAQMTAPTNFTAGDIVEVCYQMGVREC